MRPWKVRGAVGIMALLMLVGCASMSSRESTGDVSKDRAITTKVQSSFVADPLVGASAINVETRRGVVHLTGSVTKLRQPRNASGRLRGRGRLRVSTTRAITRAQPGAP